VAKPWSRNDRRYVEFTIQIDDVRRASACGALAWSTYTFEPATEGLHFHQSVGAPPPVDPGVVNWTGTELAALRLHLPSPVYFHNVRRLDSDAPGDVDRGNILTFEQTLTDRRAGKPIEADVRMGAVSILHNTLWMFVGSFVAAVLVLAALVWALVRKGRRQARAGRKA
jgi:hypothetical protein